MFPTTGISVPGETTRCLSKEKRSPAIKNLKNKTPIHVSKHHLFAHKTQLAHIQTKFLIQICMLSTQMAKAFFNIFNVNGNT